MTITQYVAIFRWGDNPDTDHGMSFGSALYDNLDMLYAYESDAVGYFEVKFELPTERQFREMVATQSEAV